MIRLSLVLALKNQFFDPFFSLESRQKTEHHIRRYNQNTLIIQLYRAFNS